MIKIILVGRLVEGNRLVGGKFINLQTLETIFVEIDDFTSVFNSYEVVNCKYGSYGLRSTKRNFSIKSVSLYSSHGNLIKSGVFSESELAAKELHINPDSVIFRICGALVFGAISDPDSFKALRHAEIYYNEIRSMSTDVQRIAQNLNMTENDIMRIKNYLWMPIIYLMGIKGLMQVFISLNLGRD